MKGAARAAGKESGRPDGPRVFLLSPAFLGGVRATLLLNPRAGFARAKAFQAEGLSIAEVFAFASGLYFRGKIAYARQFVRPERGDLVRVITTNAGLVDPERVIGPRELLAFGASVIDAENPDYLGPLRRDAGLLAPAFESAVLLGSIATAKYREVLLEAFGERLLFPRDFVGRGDMSRGALLLKAARLGRELEYLRLHKAKVTGRRAPGVRNHPVFGERKGRRR
ncbi:MAG TPA: hypothetical protein VGF85_00775 [Opitutaceae bacterium]|jgi:hypothetical protein